MAIDIRELHSSTELPPDLEAMPLLERQASLIALDSLLSFFDSEEHVGFWKEPLREHTPGIGDLQMMRAAHPPNQAA